MVEAKFNSKKRKSSSAPTDTKKDSSSSAEGTTTKQQVPGNYVKKQRSHADLVAAGNALMFGDSLKSLPKEQREARVASALDAFLKANHETAENTDNSSLPVLVKLALKHDSSRVLQNCLKHCSNETRDRIVAGLQGHFAMLSSNVYGFRVVTKILAYHGSEDSVREAVMKDLKPQLKTLALSKDSSKVVDYIWRNLSSERQKRLICRPFYGREFELFSLGDEENPISFDELIVANPQKTKNILHNVHNALSRLLDKHLVDTGLCHRLLLEYLNHATDQQKKDLIPECLEHIAKLLQTKEGVRGVCRLLQYAAPKERKLILRSFKGYVSEMALDNEGYLALLCAMAVVDDTSLVVKTILNELNDVIEKVIKGGNSRKLFLQALSPNNAAYLTSQELEFTKPIEGFTFKDNTSRSAELTAALNLSALMDKFGTYIKNKLTADIIVEVIKFFANDEKNTKVNALKKRSGSGQEDMFHWVLDSVAKGMTAELLEEMSLKRLLNVIDQSATEAHAIEVAGTFLTHVMQNILQLDDAAFSKLLASRGSWFVVKLLECKAGQGSEQRAPLLQRISSVASGELAKTETPGLKALRGLL